MHTAAASPPHCPGPPPPAPAAPPQTTRPLGATPTDSSDGRPSLFRAGPGGLSRRARPQNDTHTVTHRTTPACHAGDGALRLHCLHSDFSPGAVVGGNALPPCFFPAASPIPPRPLYPPRGCHMPLPRFCQQPVPAVPAPVSNMLVPYFSIATAILRVPPTCCGSARACCRRRAGAPMDHGTAAWNGRPLPPHSPTRVGKQRIVTLKFTAPRL
jgi:hypothetical protein